MDEEQTDERPFVVAEFMKPESTPEAEQQSSQIVDVVGGKDEE